LCQICAAISCTVLVLVSLVTGDEEEPGKSASVESVAIALSGDRLSMVVSSQQSIERFAKFHAQGSGSSGCSSLFRSADATAPTPVDPTSRTLLQVYSQDGPGKFLGEIKVSTRFFPSGPATFVFNEYDQDKEGSLSRSEFAALI